jgi:sortase A
MTAPTAVTDATGVIDVLETGEAVPRVETFVPEPTKRTGRVSAGSIARRGVKLFLLTIVAFLVFANWASGLVQARTQLGLQHRFHSELASNLAPIGGAIPRGAPVAVLQSSAIGLDQVVVEGSRSTQLRAGPGHVVGSPLPGQPGNAVIAGRRTMYRGPFGRIGSLQPGDRIRVTTGQGVSHYVVTDVRHLTPGDGSFVQDRGDDRLTLFTSASSWNADGRLVVTAELDGEAFAATELLRRLDADGLGLTGERDNATNLLVWLELLAGAALLTAFFASRWSRSRTWLVCAPVLALLCWMFFESAARVLPATL